MENKLSEDSKMSNKELAENNMQDEEFKKVFSNIKDKILTI